MPKTTHAHALMPSADALALQHSAHMRDYIGSVALAQFQSYDNNYAPALAATFLGARVRRAFRMR